MLSILERKKNAIHLLRLATNHHLNPCTVASSLSSLVFCIGRFLELWTLEDFLTQIGCLHPIGGTTLLHDLHLLDSMELPTKTLSTIIHFDAKLNLASLLRPFKIYFELSIHIE